MILIRDIVQQALSTGSLSIWADEQLQLLQEEYEYEDKDIDALMILTEAVESGRVKKEGVKQKTSPKPKRKRDIVKMKLVCPSAIGALVLATIVFAVPKSDNSVLFPSTNGNVNQLTL